MNLLAVILHYGNPDLSRELARSLREADPGRAADVRVLDNAAPESFPGAWHREPQNLFWAGALERCVALAEAEGFSHLWFLNNDVRFLRPLALTGVEARLSRLAVRFGREPGLWSPSVAVNPYHPQMCPARPTVDGVRRVRLLDCVAPVLNLAAVHDAGGLDAAANPRGYGVDMWLSLRIAERGWPVLVEQGMTVRHKAHGTARMVPGFMDEAAAAEHAFCSVRIGPDWRAQLEAMKQADASAENLYLDRA